MLNRTRVANGIPILPEGRELFPNVLIASLKAKALKIETLGNEEGKSKYQSVVKILSDKMSIAAFPQFIYLAQTKKGFSFQDLLTHWALFCEISDQERFQEGVKLFTIERENCISLYSYILNFERCLYLLGYIDDPHYNFGHGETVIYHEKLRDLSFDERAYALKDLILNDPLEQKHVEYLLLNCKRLSEDFDLEVLSYLICQHIVFESERYSQDYFRKAIEIAYLVDEIEA